MTNQTIDVAISTLQLCKRRINEKDHPLTIQDINLSIEMLLLLRKNAGDDDRASLTIGDHTFKTMEDFIAYSKGRKDGWNDHIKACENAGAVENVDELKSEIYAYVDNIYGKNGARNKTFLDLTMEYLIGRGLLKSQNAGAVEIEDEIQKCADDLEISVIDARSVLYWAQKRGLLKSQEGAKNNPDEPG